MRELIPYTAFLSGPLTVIGMFISTMSLVRYRLTRRGEHR